MTQRTRERRTRRTNRHAAVLTQPQTRPQTQGERPATQQIEARGRPFPYRIISGGIALMMGGLLAYFLLSDAFYVDELYINGLRYLRTDEIETVTAIEGWHVMWLSADTVRERALRAPSVADIGVQLGWPPQLVTIQVSEREPALIWEQDGNSAWVDVQGRLMAQRQQRDDLLRIVTDNRGAEMAVIEGRLQDDVVLGALQLQELLADVTLLTYDPVQGLGYVSPEGWAVWLGVGTGMQEKLQIYDAIVATVREQGIQPREVNVVNPDHPYYTFN
jgi:cell division septal protein FtsQ